MTIGGWYICMTSVNKRKDQVHFYSKIKKVKFFDDHVNEDFSYFDDHVNEDFS